MSIHISVPPRSTFIHYQFLIFAIIAAQFGLYILIRQLVNTKEWLLACKLDIDYKNTLVYPKL